jgi:dCMP deaminase
MILTWDQYFLSLCKLVSLRSKDPDTQVGCVIVDHEQKIIGTGYNGHVSGTDFTFEKPYKYTFMIHSEENTLLNSTKSDLSDCTMYCTLFPCEHCTLLICQKKIKKIIYLEYREKYSISKQIFDTCGIPYEQYQGDSVNININI